jgi:hypothetical protein
VLKLVPGRTDAEKTVHTNIALVLMNANDIAGSVRHWEQVCHCRTRGVWWCCMGGGGGGGRRDQRLTAQTNF